MNRQSARSAPSTGPFAAISFRHATVWIAAGSLALAASLWLDRPVDAALQLHDAPFEQAAAQWLTRTGEWWIAALIGFALTGFFFFQRRFYSARAAAIVTITGLVTGLAATLLRSVIGRARPNAYVAQGFYGPWHDGHWIIGQYQFSSFPSGHAATLMGLAVAAWLIRRRFGMILALVALLVSWSRVAQASHHLSDIVGSAVLSLCLAPFLMAQLRAATHPLLIAARSSRRPPSRSRPLRTRELVDQS